MPKMKTRRAAAKRFKLTAKGKIRRNKAFHRHILTKKTTKAKRGHRGTTLVHASDEKQVKRMLPYG